MRKSPYRHHVRNHRRRGRPVRSYERGKGKQPFHPTLKHAQSSSSSFLVHIKYVSLPTETFTINAPNHNTAIEFAMGKRISIEVPKEVEATKQ